jgi:hypothetical protein
LRALGLEDFRAVLRTMRPSTVKAEEYNKVSQGGREVAGGDGSKEGNQLPCAVI